MKKLITAIAAVWVFGVFILLQIWFWSGVHDGVGSPLMMSVVGSIVFLVVGVAPVKIVKMLANIFK